MASREARQTVHPCAGREHPSVNSRRQGYSGSPLRGQGTLGQPPLFQLTTRFTPARAGNTPPIGNGCCAPPVHPCAGREHVCRCGIRSPWGGSPLRGQGTPQDHATSQEPSRFTPARAGNTVRRSAGRSAVAVHPCAGREHIPASVPRYGNAGSPLRGQGTHRFALHPYVGDRFTPARAGNTCRSE